MNFKLAVPSAITCLNLLCGFAVLLVEPKYGVALILLGGFFDLWDGLAARLLKAQSEFGAELDSLADLITFCVAPAYLLFQYLDEPYSYISLLIPVTGAIRLAKFNISKDQSYYFKGLATPSSAIFFCGILIAKESLQGLELLVVVLVFLACLLNVSNIKMFSIKGINKDPYTKFYLGAFILAIVIAALINWRLSLIVGISCYLLLAIAYHFQITSYENKNPTS